MNSKFNTLIYLILISFNVFSQKVNFKAIYGIKTNIDFSQIKDIDKNDILDLKQVINDSNSPSTAKFELLFNEVESLFYYKAGLNITSSRIDLASIKAKLIGKIYTDINTHEIIQQKETLGESFRIVKNLDDYKWVLLNEKKQFGKYVCYKAIFKDSKKRVNKIIEAWYTPEISANTGPLGYGGLPGLIVVLKKDIFTYYLERLTPYSKKKISIPKKGKIVSLKEYDSIYDILYAKKEQLEMDKY